MIRLIMVAVMVLTGATSVSAEEVFKAIYAGYLYDAKAAKISQNQVIMIKNDRIIAIEHEDEIYVTRAAKKIDLSGYVVLPSITQDVSLHSTGAPLVTTQGTILTLSLNDELFRASSLIAEGNEATVIAVKAEEDLTLDRLRNPAFVMEKGLILKETAE
ncbi:hypothetical protein GCM10017044_27740 [Kordiimonas sediminis]|uniref:Amidohydrolase n=1 Tax=Kordiimonas sediminis TaxID=1735581 RepID=A0A919AZZ4_9PROT|nr:hypothetical protein [Kordiimonas sediminis]GHF30803.1 hypothetical protein GCM10017044_27740 [Kordiimonas sediminis]